MFFYPNILKDSFELDDARMAIRFVRHQRISSMTFELRVISGPDITTAEGWYLGQVAIQLPSPLTRPNLYILYPPPNEHPRAMFILDAVRLAQGLKEKYKLWGAAN